MRLFSNLLKDSVLICIVSLCSAVSCHKTTGGNETPGPDTTVVVQPTLARMDLWLTKGDKSALFQKQNTKFYFSKTAGATPVITIDTTQTFQTIDGFGYTLTGGSAQHLSGMSAAARSALLRELFATDGTNIGVSYLRVSIGASDLDSRPFSYNDLPAGETDVELKKFDLGPDKNALIPILKEILAINPDIKILGSPWSPPAWMKDNKDTRGGSLQPEYYDVYGRYFVKYI
jgi:glucosylceramidase